MAGPYKVMFQHPWAHHFYADGTLESHNSETGEHRWSKHNDKDYEMSRVCDGIRKIGNYEVPTPGLKIKHVFEPYKGEVLMIANAKYASPATTVVVFRGDDNEIYSRPLESFWDNWQRQSQEYVIQTQTRVGTEYLRRRDGRSEWVMNKANATRFSKSDADSRINMLVDVGAAGSYHRIPV